jgi:hypothetical protein
MEVFIMPKITTFFFCEEAQPNNQTGKLNVSGPLHVFTPAFVPGMFSFSVVIGIMGIDLTQRSHKLRIIMTGPNKELDPVINTQDIDMFKQDGEVVYSLPPEYRGLFINIDFRNVVFREEGLYNTEIYLDGELLGNSEVPVIGVEK